MSAVPNPPLFSPPAGDARGAESAESAESARGAVDTDGAGRAAEGAPGGEFDAGNSRASKSTGGRTIASIPQVILPGRAESPGQENRLRM